MTFEEKMKRLEEIVGTLENEAVSLEQSVKLYEEAKTLSAELNAELEASMKKLSFIVEEGEVKPFDEEETESEI